MSLPLAVIGAEALYIMYGWLACCIAASYLSGRKGYGEKIGLASGLFLVILGPIIWLLVPPKPNSDWKRVGPFGRGRSRVAGPSGAGPKQGTGAQAS